MHTASHRAPHTTGRPLVASALRALALVAVLAALACGNPSEPTPPPLDLAPAVRVEGPGGLVNTLTLSATQLSRGDTLRVRHLLRPSLWVTATVEVR